ncbi:hypothetical protein C8Q74DRAFT_414277 [Fomes fomentarius]|nr:hypothetical protein C8Q74DRAFT_414277 [Fomes fomentarius]
MPWSCHMGTANCATFGKTASCYTVLHQVQQCCPPLTRPERTLCHYVVGMSTRGLVPGLAKSISVVHLDFRDCGIIQDIFNDSGDSTAVLGATLRLCIKRATVEAVALATPTTVFLVFLGKKDPPTPASSAGVTLFDILAHPKCLLAGLNIARTALLLHRQTGAVICGIELGALPLKSQSKHVSAADLADQYISHNARKRDIHSLWLKEGNLDLALKAWLLACIADHTLHKIAAYARVNTRHLHAHQLSYLAQQVINAELVEADKPKRVDNDFDQIHVNKKGDLVLRNARFKTRVRKSAQTVIEINGGQVHAQAVTQKGKSTGLTVFKGKFQGKVEKVSVIGREEYTLAELSRDEFLLRVLQGAAKLDASPYVRLLWSPDGSGKKGKKGKGKDGKSKITLDHLALFAKLNASQKRVAAAMMADDEPLVLAHGPPGTGKTSTIATALSYWQTHGEPAWVIAHSNVGVQNIAASLYEKGIDFRLIVSKEFHFEWHEHIYEGIEHRLIRSDDFGDAFDPRNYIGDCKIILCTLSMLSNPALYLPPRSTHSNSSTCSTNSRRL